MSLEKRIHKLELRVHGDDKETGMTWEQVLHVYRAIDPETFKERAKRTPRRSVSSPIRMDSFSHSTPCYSLVLTETASDKCGTVGRTKQRSDW